MQSRIEKLTAIAAAKNVDAFLVTSAPSLKYLSGYFFYFEYGPSPFQFLPAALFVMPGKSASLLIADNELGQSANIITGISIKPYSSYVYETPLEFTRQFLNQLQEVIGQSGTGITRIGIEQNSFPLAIAQSLSSQYPKIEFVDIAMEIAQLRIVKDSYEIELIRQASRLSDIGQASVLVHAKAGITELELFNLVRNDIEASAGTRVPLMADLSSGTNTSSGGGMPTNKIINAGDVILSDFTPCLNGYWGDSCNTMVVGKPSASQEKNFILVKEALEIGINAIRPGEQAREIDQLMRGHIGNYPHHSGHGVGTMNHEEPRIVPYNKTELVPNMVIALEPAIYEKDFGIRLEHLVVVTATGCEILTKFQHCFEQ
ncbi:MAG: Xaa-Pro peptidase family protein [Ginsengibacter sp.]